MRTCQGNFFLSVISLVLFSAGSLNLAPIFTRSNKPLVLRAAEQPFRWRPVETDFCLVPQGFLDYNPLIFVDFPIPLTKTRFIRVGLYDNQIFKPSVE
jgi:hypothetical protein